MNITELEPLKSLTLPIVVPKVLPGPLTLEKVVPLPDGDSGDGYRIEWSAGEGKLTLLGASGGIGDRMPGDESISFRSPTFGDCSLEVEGKDLATNWMSEMESGLPAYSLMGEGVTKEQFLEIARSLDYVKL